MKKVDLSSFSKATIGQRAEIYCEEFVHTGYFRLGDNVSIKARKIILGNNASVESNVTIRALKDEMESFVMGDESLIGFNSQVLVPDFFIGDYSQVFNSALISGYKPITIGHNCWVGQGAILNSADTLTIGNNVRMGGCQVWTHVASGELLEGSNFYNVAPVIIEDNVWLMGFGHIVTPGVVLAKNTVVMAGSVVTKSTEPFKTYSGIPAIDVSDKLPAWKRMSIDVKFDVLKGFVSDFISQYPEYTRSVLCLDNSFASDKALLDTGLEADTPHLFFLKDTALDAFRESIHSVFDLTTKNYTKRKTAIEVAWMKFSIGYRARFLPYNFE